MVYIYFCKTIEAHYIKIDNTLAKGFSVISENIRNDLKTMFSMLVAVVRNVPGVFPPSLKMLSAQYPCSVIYCGRVFFFSFITFYFVKFKIVNTVLFYLYYSKSDKCFHPHHHPRALHGFDVFCFMIALPPPFTYTWIHHFSEMSVLFSTKSP